MKENLKQVFQCELEFKYLCIIKNYYKTLTFSSFFCSNDVKSKAASLYIHPKAWKVYAPSILSNRLSMSFLRINICREGNFQPITLRGRDLRLNFFHLQFFSFALQTLNKPHVFFKAPGSIENFSFR